VLSNAAMVVISESFCGFVGSLLLRDEISRELLVYRMGLICNGISLLGISIPLLMRWVV